MRTRHSVRPAHALAGLLLAAALALTGCSGPGHADDGGDNAKVAGSGAMGSAQDAKGFQDSKDSQDAKGSPAKTPDLTTSRAHIIRTASLTVQVKDVAKALDQARTAAEGPGGYVGAETTTRDAQGHERTRVVLRVPNGAYDEVLTELQGTGKLVDRTTKAQDVTDQVVDVDSRVRSQRASVARIRALMDKADKLSDVVQLEGELSSRQSDLESLLARQASLKDRTNLATITLSLSRTPAAEPAPDGAPGFTDALSGGWHAFVTMFRWIALFLGAILPFATPVAVLLVLWLRVVRPRRTTAAAVRAAQAPVGGGHGPEN